MKVHSQLKEACLENVASNPVAGTMGRMVYNTTKKQVYVDNGSKYVSIDGNNFEYRVKENDAEDLYNALTNSNNYASSIYIPDGTYTLNKSIDLGRFIRFVEGESIDGVIISFINNAEYHIKGNALVDRCLIKGLTVEHATATGKVCFLAPEADVELQLYEVTIKDFKCALDGISDTYKGSLFGSFIKIYSTVSNVTGTVRHCKNLSNIIVDLTYVVDSEQVGFYNCDYISNCQLSMGAAFSTVTQSRTIVGFLNCDYISSCQVTKAETEVIDNASYTVTVIIFKECNYLSNCEYRPIFYYTFTAGTFNFYGCYKCSNLSQVFIVDGSGHYLGDEYSSFIGFYGESGDECKILAGCNASTSCPKESDTIKGFLNCKNLSACQAIFPFTDQVSFEDCQYMTACVGFGAHSGITNEQANFYP